MANRDSESPESIMVEAKVHQLAAENEQRDYANRIESGDTEYDELRSISEAKRVTSLMDSLKVQYKPETKQILVTNYNEHQKFQIRVYYLIDAVSRLTIFDENNEIIPNANTFIDELPKYMTEAAKSVVESTVYSIGERVKARNAAKRARAGGGHYKLKRYSKTRRRYGKARRTRKTR
jgi:hypothetical protein